jgi:hypothetical protein
LFCLDEHRVEAIDDGRGRAWALSSFLKESLYGRRTIDRSDGIEDIDPGYGGLVIPQGTTEQPI